MLGCKCRFSRRLAMRIHLRMSPFVRAKRVSSASPPLTLLSSQVALLLVASAVAFAEPSATFVAGGGSGNAAPFHTLAWSPDGVTWTGLGNSVFDTSTTSVSYCSILDTWVSTGGNRNTIAFSPDGKNWTGLGNTAISTTGNDIHWFDGIFIAVGGAGVNTMARSIDGKTWTGLGSATFNGQGYSVMYSRKTQRWVAAGCW